MIKDKIRLIFTKLNENKFDEAEKDTLNLLHENKDSIEVANVLAIVYASKKNYPEAINILKKILHNNPQFSDALINLANIYRDLNDYFKAIFFYEKCLKLNQNNDFVLLELSKVYDLNEQFSKSEQIYKKLISKYSKNLEILFEYGKNKLFVDNLDEANIIADQILKINNKSVEGYILKSLVFVKVYDYTSAKKNLEIAKQINPNYAKIYFYLAAIQAAENNHINAIENFKKSINLEDNPQSKYNLSLSFLATNSFEDGWKYFKHRTAHYIFKNKIKNQKEWDGKSFEGTLIVHGEQGIGDEILFSSMFTDLLKIQKKILVTCEKRLLKVFKRSFESIDFLERGIKIPFYKNQKNIAAGDLGQFFRNNPGDFITNKWIKPNKILIEKYEKYIKKNKKIRVGIAWTSFTSKSNNTYKERKVSLSQISECLPEDKFDLINLQYGNIEEDIKNLKKDSRRELVLFDSVDYKNDIDDLAAIIMNCDFVVSVASFTSSFSGSLGKKTITMVPQDYGWIWTPNSKNQSIWFPEIKLIFQEKSGSWKEVLNKLKSEINNFKKN